MASATRVLLECKGSIHTPFPSPPLLQILRYGLVLWTPSRDDSLGALVPLCNSGLRSSPAGLGGHPFLLARTNHDVPSQALQVLAV